MQFYGTFFHICKLKFSSEYLWCFLRSLEKCEQFIDTLDKGLSVDTAWYREYVYIINLVLSVYCNEVVFH